jgi:hypothetical protein
MDKPFDLQVEDFRTQLAGVINSNQNIPLSVMVLIVNEMSDSVNGQYRQYSSKLKEDYARAVEAEKEAEKQPMPVDDGIIRK